LNFIRRFIGHNEAEGNEVADEWAKDATNALRAARYAGPNSNTGHDASTTHITSGSTEAKWNEYLAWVKARWHGKQYGDYRLCECQRKVQAASREPKSIATRFNEFRSGKLHTGPHLAKVGEAANDNCWWCGSSATPTREHLFTHCC
jgi:hypothetical protein